MNTKTAIAGIFALSLFASGQASADDTVFKVFFDNGGNSVSEDADEVLGQAVQWSSSSGSTQIDVIGHYDSAEDGSGAALGAARAQAVSDALRKDGLPSSVNISASVGTVDPSGASRDMMNRLVEVIIH